MIKEFVPYEQALAIKELGFNEPCIYYVDKKDNGYIYNFELHPDEFIKQCSNLDINVITAPLYQQAFRWFRDKHKLHGYCDYYRDEYWEYYIGYTNDNDIDVVTKDSFKTCEEAELACLKKLIEIVKEKK